MEANYPSSRKFNTQILQELENLSESLYQTHVASPTTWRSASLVFPRDSIPPILANKVGQDKDELNLNPKRRSRWMPLSP
ncbi:protein PLASTID MOVEMENT IMPAIRED 1-like [Salvia divinorum]|uniref:Protein PLASTID MOVEMENT IMPAIRED 1-like n=1 Tax=Salvia divinorum TaxID=28513 RepID=A0ABD1G944_SALDI